MDVGWQLIWVVVTIGTACHGSCRYRAPAYKKLASSGSPHRYTSLIELSFKQKIEMDPSLFSMNGTCKQIRSNSCDWFGITCANERVFALYLSGCSLVAPLDSIAALTPLDQLQEVHLANNSLYSYNTDTDTDQILPSSLGACTRLRVLNLSQNDRQPSHFLNQLS